MLADTAKELRKWSRFILGMRPKNSFESYPNPSIPNYERLDTWLAHPDIDHKGRMRPREWEETITDEVPTFFIHPTTYFAADNWNADINHAPSRRMIEEMVIPGQPSVFNHLGEIYAPIYRQATFYAFLMSSDDAYAALELAYQDVSAAFEVFLKQIGDRPFFIAGHSQGTVMGMRILSDKIDKDKELSKRLVAAYLPGYKFPKQHFDSCFEHIKAGEKPDTLHCVLAWDTFLDGFHPLNYIDNSPTWVGSKNGGTWKRRVTETSFCVNPITWDIDRPQSTKEEHLGAVVTEYDRKAFRWMDASKGDNYKTSTLSLSKPNPNMVDAKVGLGNLLYISKPPGQIYNIGKMPGGNYHVYDYTLFYMDIRANASLRWKTYKSLYLD